MSFPIMNEEESLRLAKKAPEWEELEKANPFFAHQIPYGDVVKTRNSFPKPTYPPTPSTLEEVDIEIPMTDGHKNPARVFKPAGQNGSRRPLVVMFHGGGYCFGDYTIETREGRAFSEKQGVVVISIGYRLAPEHPFPAPINDAWDGLKWAAAHAEDLGADPSAGFIVGGTSAGGGISSVLAHLARDESLSPPLTGQFLCITSGCPAVMMPEKYKPGLFSNIHNADAPIIGSETLRMFREAHKPPQTPHPRFAALLNPNGHKGLPPAYFQHCGLDPLRDEGLIYEKALQEEGGVKTRHDMYVGLPHGFWSAMPDTELANKRMADAVNGIGWLLGRDS